MATVERHIRQDGKDKVTGSGRYTADLTLTGMLHAKFLYPSVAHGVITRIDTSKAKALPGVHAVITHADVPDVLHGDFIQDRYLFAKDRVRFQGDLIAAVAATTPEIAAEAVALIEVEIEPLPVLTDIEEALESDVIVHPAWESYEGGEIVRKGNTATYSTIVKGDADSAIKNADAVVKGRYVADQSHGAPIEPRAVVAQWNGDKVTIWTTTQVPFAARAGVCHTLGLAENQVRIIVPLLGGGFGSKCGFHFEAHVAALARATKRPVKLVFSRHEEFVAPDRRREGMVIELESGVNKDGTIVARRGRVVIDNGAYTADSAFFPQLAAMHAAGPYKIETVNIEGHLVYTNTNPSGSIRAPTAPQACWAVEQHTDECARAIGMDPAEFRRRNLLDTGDEGPSGQEMELNGNKQCLEKALAMIGYGKDLPSDEAIGIASGWWPSFAAPSGAYIKLNSDGSGQIVTGAQECGTGAVMALPILAAAELGMKPEDFQILYQDTDAGPYDMGATGSQTTFNNGRAIQEAARQIREQLLDLAEQELEASRGDLELVDGHVQVKGSPDRKVSIPDLAGTAAGDQLLLGRGSGTPPETPTVNADLCVGRMGMESWCAPAFITHAVRVKVDRETGVIRVLEVAAAHDAGTIVNPIGAEGQVEGGVVMGIGMALLEGTKMGDDGFQANAHLTDYKLQTMSDIPPISIAFADVPSPAGGPNGAKSIAEPPNVPTAGAIANAVRQVIGRDVRYLPMTPERVWGAANGIEVG